jgi:hypothetical protein
MDNELAVVAVLLCADGAFLAGAWHRGCSSIITLARAVRLGELRIGDGRNAKQTEKITAPDVMLRPQYADVGDSTTCMSYTEGSSNKSWRTWEKRVRLCRPFRDARHQGQRGPITLIWIASFLREWNGGLGLAICTVRPGTGVYFHRCLGARTVFSFRQSGALLRLVGSVPCGRLPRRYILASHLLCVSQNFLG